MNRKHVLAAPLFVAALLLAVTAFAQGGDAGEEEVEATANVDTYVSPIHQEVGANQSEQVGRAADALTQALAASNSPVKARLACWLEKAKDPQVDDRLLEWSRICPIRSSGGLLGDRRCATSAVQRDLMLDLLSDSTQADEADRKLNLSARLRALVLVLGSQATGNQAADAVQKLEDFEFDVRTASIELSKVQSDSPLRHYLALKQWMAAKRQDERSLYKLCPLGG